MAGGVPAGTLYVEVVAEIAKLQQDMATIKRSVGDMSTDVARKAKAANDNLSNIGRGASAGIQQFSRDVLALKTSLDPAWAAQQRYNEQVELGTRAFNAGAITREQFVTHMRAINSALKETGPAAQAASAAIEREAQALREAEVAARTAAQRQAALVAQANALRAQLDPMFAAQQRFNQAMDLADDLYRAGAISAREYAAAQTLARSQLQEHAAAVAGARKPLNDLSDGMVRTSGSGRMMAQQLSQVAQQAAAGTNVIQALAIQLPDIAMMMDANGKSAGAFARFMGGPWGLALTSAIAVAAAFGVKMLETEDSTKKSERASRSFADVLRDSTSSWEEVTKAAKAYADQQQKNRALTLDQIQNEARATAERIRGAVAERQRLLAELETAKLRADIAAQTGSGEGLAFALREQARVEASIKANVAAIESLKVAAGEATIAAANAIAELDLDPAKKLKTGFDILRNQARGSITDVNDLADALTKLGRQEQEAQKALTESTRQRASETIKLARVTGEEIARALGTTVTSGLRSAERNRAVGGSANSYHLTGQAIDIPLTVNGRPLTKAGIRAVLEPLGIEIKELLGPGDAGHNDHFHIAFGIKRLAPDQVQRLQEDAAEAAEKAVAAARKAWLDGWAALFEMQSDITKALLPKMLEQEAAERAAFNRKLATPGEEVTKGLDAAADANAAWNEQLQETVRLLDDIGGAGKVLGDIGALLVGVRTGDFSGLRGPAGALLSNIFTAQGQDGRRVLNGLGQEFRSALDSVFGGNGKFFQALQGATTGAGVGQVLFAGNQGSQIGSMIGGAIGQEVGAQVLTGALGKLGGAAGPLGAIAGSLLGGIVGGLFKQAKSKANVLTNGSLSGTFGGTGGDYTRAADSLSQSVLSSLDKLAKSLDATATGAFKLSIGMRDGNYVVNPTGGGTKSSMGAVNFGKDADAALKFAIQDAISDGVFEGLSAGVERLLKGEGDDLEEQLQKALSFQGVFDELEQMKDPRSYEEKQLDKWRKGMDAIFAEAGATADEIAKLEELTGLKRKEIVEKYSEELANAEEIANQRRALEIQIMELTGDTAGALAASRQLELAAADASLHPLMNRIYALQDEAKALDEWKATQEAAANSLLNLRERLLQAQGDDAGLRAFQRSQEWSKATAAEREALTQIYAAEDAARKAAEAAARREEAQRRAEEAARAAAELANNRARLEIDLLNALGLSEAALAKQRQLELASMDASLRGLQQQVWAAQEAAATAEKFRDFGKSLREFRGDLVMSSAATADSYRAAQVKWMTTNALASAGNVDAIGKLQGVSQSFLDASLSRATTREQYQRDLSMVLRGVDDTLAYTDNQVDVAERQLDAIAAGNNILRNVEARLTTLVENTQAENIAIKQELAKLRRAAEGPDGDGVQEVRVVT